MPPRFSLDFSTSDGLSQAEADFAARQVGLLPPGAREFMESAGTPAVERFLLASQLAGLSYEADFWRVAKRVLPSGDQMLAGGDQMLLGVTRSSSPSSLDRRFDLILDAETYKKMEREKLLLQESRAGVNRDTVSFKVYKIVPLNYRVTKVLGDTDNVDIKMRVASSKSLHLSGPMTQISSSSQQNMCPRVLLSPCIIVFVHSRASPHS